MNRQRVNLIRSQGGGSVGGALVGGALVGGKLPNELRVALYRVNPTYASSVERGYLQAARYIPPKGSPAAEERAMKARATRQRNKAEAIAMTLEAVSPLTTPKQISDIYKRNKKVISQANRYEKGYAYRAAKALAKGKPAPEKRGPFRRPSDGRGMHSI